jgi:thiamine-monophosphate kinase
VSAAGERVTAMGPGGEFDVIRELMKRWGSRAVGVGDDAALLSVPEGQRLVVSTDVSIDGVHFRRDWLTPREIGYRATAAALSDLAAMAATPLGVLIVFAMPTDFVPLVHEIADGVGDAVDAVHTSVVGGDLSVAGELSIGVTVLGACERALTRSGASGGDHLYVTGTLGGPLAALEAWRAGHQPGADARARFARPVPRIAAARWLVEHGATAAIDISDGLLGDATHLAAASGVQLEVELDRLPIVADSSPVAAASSGEEYELLVTAPSALDVRDFERECGIPLTRIGMVRAGTPELIALLNGKRVAPAAGYSHF